MKITVSGKAGSGKSVVAKGLAGELGFSHYSTGDFWREIAEEMNMDVLELNRYAESHKAIDYRMDERQKQIGRKQDDFVMDGRLSWYFIPDSIKIFLDVADEVAAERIIGDETRSTEDYEDVSDAVAQLQERRNSEKKRYKQLYGVNPYDTSNYDIVVDTTELTIEEVIETVMDKITKYKG